MKRRLKVEVLEDRIVPAFLAPVDYTVGLFPNDVKAGDFNGDRIPDLATANTGSDTVSVLLGNGDGTFQSARNTPISAYPLFLAVGDFNRDGKLDLAAANDYVPGNDGVSILLGRGDGTFVQANAPDWFDWSSAIVAGDLTGDNKLDLVTSSVDDYGNSYISALIGHGDGTFTPISDAMPGPHSSDALALADFDGDGNLDLVAGANDVVGSSDGSAVVFRGNGDGTFQTPGNDLGVGGTTLTVADLNGDGKLDIATNGADLVNVLRGNGDGTFRPAQSFASEVNPWSINAAYVSSDGVLDLVVTNHDGVAVLLGNGDGSFAPPITMATGSTPRSLAMADFNADGRPDAAVSRDSSDKVSVLLNDGSWSPDDPPSVSIRDATVTEGNTGTASATFTVTLSKASNAKVTVDYATADITATAGSDYRAGSGVVTIPAGQTSATVTVAIVGDRLGEPDETFAVNLSAAANATIGDGRAIGSILDNEPRISISDVRQKEGKKNQTTRFTFTVMLSAAYDQPVTVSFRTVDGTATTGDNDYVTSTGTITFKPGETTKTITIVVQGDSKREVDETFYLDLSGNSSNSVLDKRRGIGTILNDD
jgi:hypothetical protein